MDIKDRAIRATVIGVAMVLFGMPTVTSFAADQFQSGADLLGTPPERSGPPPNTGTPEETAKLAVAAGKYDIAGMKLGMPLKEAMQALKAHNPKLQMKKDTIKYDVLGGEMLYGLIFMGPEERFIYRLTMPPNPIVVSKLSRMLIFTKETAPTQQTLVEDLIKKYGPPSSDSGPNQLNDANQRILVWFDDAKGNRMKEYDPVCLTNSSFSSGNGSQGVDPVPMQQMEAGMNEKTGTF